MNQTRSADSKRSKFDRGRARQARQPPLNRGRSCRKSAIDSSSDEITTGEADQPREARKLPQPVAIRPSAQREFGPESERPRRAERKRRRISPRSVSTDRCAAKLTRSRLVRTAAPTYRHPSPAVRYGPRNGEVTHRQITIALVFLNVENSAATPHQARHC